MMETISIEKAFKETGNFSFKDRGALQHCLDLAEEHQLRPAEIAQKYDAYCAFM